MLLLCVALYADTVCGIPLSQQRWLGLVKYLYTCHVYITDGDVMFAYFLCPESAEFYIAVGAYNVIIHLNFFHPS